MAPVSVHPFWRPAVCQKVDLENQVNDTAVEDSYSFKGV